MKGVYNPSHLYANHNASSDKELFVDVPNEVSTLPLCDYDNRTTLPDNGTAGIPFHLVVLPYVTVTCYSTICLIGLVGNGLVIYVVLRFAKMKTVTNMYILNLALSDILFLVTLPMTVTTTVLRHWIFGFALCKLHYVLYSLNLFGGVFNLCVMSADRYLAVCHPIRSMKYRTPRIALFSCFCIWSISFIVMVPVIMFTKTKDSRDNPGRRTCTMEWPTDQIIPVHMAFIWYCFILGFAIPVSLISVFYILVILRLRHVGPAKKSKEKRKSHQRVTRLVLSVITVYVVCWLPYWCFQVRLVFLGLKATKPVQILFSFFTVLCYTNSMLNPFLYAFLSDNFRKSFVKAFNCVSEIEICKSAVANENSAFPRTSQTCTRNGHSQSPPEERMEMSIQDGGAMASGHAPVTEKISSKSIQDEQGFLKLPTQL